TVPRSVSEICMPSLLLSLCRSSTFWATTSFLKFCHGPRPMRSRALTACAPPAAWVLRYARQVLLPAPAFCASVWHWRSAPSRPPRSAPLPGPALVMKKVIFGDWGGGCCAWLAVDASDTAATDATIAKHLVLDIFALPFELVSRFQRALEIRYEIQSRQRHASRQRHHPRLTGSGFALTVCVIKTTPSRGYSRDLRRKDARARQSQSRRYRRDHRLSFASLYSGRGGRRSRRGGRQERAEMGRGRLPHGAREFPRRPLQEWHRHQRGHQRRALSAR